jgi:hypothetical protein
MSALASLLLAASALIIFTLGVMHLVLTFRDTKLHPREADLEAKMKEVSPVITRETTMWKAWIGFNASHSYGAILFGLVYGYLAVFHTAFLLRDPFLLIVGLLLRVPRQVLLVQRALPRHRAGDGALRRSTCRYLDLTPPLRSNRQGKWPAVGARRDMRHPLRQRGGKRRSPALRWEGDCLLVPEPGKAHRRFPT